MGGVASTLPPLHLYARGLNWKARPFFAPICKNSHSSSSIAAYEHSSSFSKCQILANNSSLSKIALKFKNIELSLTNFMSNNTPVPASRGTINILYDRSSIKQYNWAKNHSKKPVRLEM